MPRKEYGIVKPIRNTKRLRQKRDPKAWKTIYDHKNEPPLPNNIPLTPRAINHWRKTKSGMGYTNFTTLYKSDIRSILSACKRGEAVLTRSRDGMVAFYKLRGLR